MKTQVLIISSMALSVCLAACGTSSKTEPAKATPAAMTAATPSPTTTPVPTSSATGASATSSVASSSMKCKNGSDERELEVEELQPRGCKLHYKKWGQRQEIASSINGRKHCDEVAERVKKNLSDARFECR